MPDGYVLNVWMLVTNGRSSVLQSIGKALLVGFEFCPATLELRLALVV